MSSLSWLQSCECSIQPYDDSGSFSIILHWVRFIFLSPCPQRIMFSAINLLFLLTFIVLALQRLRSKFKKLGTSTLNKPLLRTDNPVFRSSIWFKVSVLVVALFSLSYGVLCVLALIQGVGSQWDLVEVLFKFFQLLANLAVLIIIIHLRTNGAVSLPMLIRIYWATNFTLMCLFAAAALIRLVSAGESPKMEIDDIFTIASLPMYGFLLIASIRGCSETFFIVENVNNENSSPEVIDSKVSGYATASLFSKAVWNWMNPLLRKGYKSPLQMEEVPLLPSDHRAEKLVELFEQNWPKDQTLIKNNPVRRLLLKCFWKDLAITGFLAVVRLCVMYVGPVLIQGFISVSSGDRNDIYQGFYLIMILLVSKVIEVLSAHHFNFLSQKLGMLIRSTLITALYKKGLRLSCSSRQAHGVGQIVNYMGVDCQQLSDLVYQLHTLWMMPFQVGVALLILYVNLGVSVLVTLISVIAVMFVTVHITRKNNTFQFHLMMNRDSRMKATTELLNYMRVIKFQAWEEHFRDKIIKCREKEYSWLSKFMYMVSGNLVLIWSVPLGMSALTFGVATLMRVRLDATTVFTATSIFKILQEPIQSFPQTLMSVSQAIISLERLDRYLISREIRDENVEREEHCDGFNAVVVKEGTFGWDDDGGEHVLKDISFEIKKGELAAIVGTVGSGKSSLLASVLGELHKSSGKVTVCGTTAYVAQTSWIQNATIEENILFGSAMDKEKYKDVVRVCCLEKDLEMMEHGDQTEIGERGINLSGGQKQRIQLARAVYQDCDIYLLDDIFSAVDAHTGSEIFKECVRGALKGKTVLLVTHQVDFLHNADIILVMREGKIVQSGKYEELLVSGLDFGALVAAYETSMELVETNSSISVVNAKLGPNSPRIGSPKSEIIGENKESSEQSKSDKNSSKLIEEEERESGRVSLNVYKQYCTEAFGWWGVVAVMLASILWQVSQMASDYWLAYETSEDRVFVPSLFLGVFSIIAVISSLFIAFRSFLVALLGLKTCQSFFKQILDSVLHAPMSFFDTTPSGRVLSRVSSDQVNIDLLIPLLLSIAILMYFTLLSILVITCQYAWPTVFFMIPLIWLNIWYQRYFIASSRELTRLDGVTRAPVIHHFSETISGVMTIRCFRNQDKFIQGNLDRVNSNARMTFHNFASNEWFGFRVELIGSFLLCFSTVFLIFLPSTIVRPAYVGLSLSYGLQLSGVLYFAVYMTSNLENRMVSVERIKQFINIPSEASWRKSDAPACVDWPNHGEIVIKDLQVRYRENTPLVLKGISLTIKGGEKIGVVGRTGSGKSTLIQVFFRLVEPHFGNIIVDGVDISKLGLHDVRSRFGIIPQEPVLFEGTVRSNIDPLGLYSEDDIWKSLERCQLKDVVAAKPEKLDASVVDSGDNWSVGQRQLLCLGRVLLKRSKILFMDEATASVDAQTDTLIQKIIRQDFSNCTIITIAHRIPTVIDCDRVLVIDAGWAKEFDNPSNLLARKSLFGALVQEYANRSSSL